MSYQKTVDAFDAWAAQSRDRSAKDLEFEAQSFQQGRLLDSTFTKREVTDVLQGQASLLLASTRSAQEASSSGVVELIKALYGEADRQAILLEVDALTHLNKASSLSAVERAEQSVALRAGRSLAPLGGGGNDNAARQLVETQAELRRVAQQLRATQTQVQSLAKEKQDLIDGVHKMGDTLTNTASMTAEAQQSTQHTAQQLAAVRSQLTEAQEVNASLRQELASSQRELQGKLAQSAQFQGLKKILVEKNDLVKRLRTALAKYDPVAASAGEDDIEAEDSD